MGKKYLVILMIALPLLLGPVGSRAADSYADSTHVLVVYGDATPDGSPYPLPSGTVVWCTNRRTGSQASGVVGTREHGTYEAVFFSYTETVAAVGDTIAISVDDAEFLPPNGIYVLEEQDVRLGSVQIDLYPDYVSGVPLLPVLAGSLGCYPNPFNPSTNFEVILDSDSRVRLTVLDLRGRLVDMVFEGSLCAGVHSLPWRAAGHGGRDLSSGVYLAKLRTERGTLCTKLILNR